MATVKNQMFQSIRQNTGTKKLVRVFYSGLGTTRLIPTGRFNLLDFLDNI